MNSDDTISLPLHHPALKKHWLLSEYGLTDADLEKLDAKTLSYELIINNAIIRGLRLRQKLKEEEIKKGIGMR